MKRKILIFSLAYFPDHVGGAEVAIKEIVDRIPSESYEFHMVTNRYDSTLPRVAHVGKILVHRIGFGKKHPTMSELKAFPLHLNKYLYQILAPLKAFQMHMTHRYDGIWAMMAHSTGIPAALFTLLFPKVPSLLTLQEGDPIPDILEKARPVLPLFRRAFTKAKIIQAISHYLGDWAKQMGATCPIVIIPNAVDTEHFGMVPNSEDLQRLREKFEKKDGEHFLITTSRLVKKNAVDDVIRALTFLPKSYRFLILGIGPDEEALRVLAKKEGVRDRVLFLGQIGHHELPTYLHLADVFVRPSLSEGMGCSFLEAMMAEVPVIATQEGGIKDFLYDPDLDTGHVPTGRAVPVFSPKIIAQKVEETIANREETREIVRNAKQMVKERYDWNLIAKQMKEQAFNPLFDTL